MKKILCCIFLFITYTGYAQVVEDFDVADVCSGNLPCWSAVTSGSGGNNKLIAPFGLASVCDSVYNPADSTYSRIFDINSTAPIDGSGSLHHKTTVIVDNSGIVTTNGIGPYTLYPPATGADGDTISFQFRIDGMHTQDTLSSISLWIVCGSFSYPYIYKPADSGIVQTISQVITDSTGGGIIQILVNEALHVTGVIDTLGYDLYIDNFSTTGSAGPLNACYSTALPLALLSFSGTSHNCHNQLQWKTAGEKNFSHFVIERSTDGKVFNSIGKVPAEKGNAGNSYVFTDDDRSSLTTYYRLKMTVPDGTDAYSKAIVMNGCKSGIITIYPNPAKDQVSISGTSAGDRIQISNAWGQVVAYRTAQTFQERINMNTWPAGLYFLTILEQTTGMRSVQRVIKE